MNWASFSSRTIVFKGMMLADQVQKYFADLQCDDLVTDLAIVHSRFSTNTFPSWERAQPFNTIAHNGEINTVRGNTNWMKSRHSSMQFDELGVSHEDADFLSVPLGLSDSGVFNNVVSLLVASAQKLSPIMKP